MKDERNFCDPERVADLEDLLREATVIISKGIDLMPLEQLRKWQGVRAWIEEIGDYVDIEGLL